MNGMSTEHGSASRDCAGGLAALGKHASRNRFPRDSSTIALLKQNHAWKTAGVLSPQQFCSSHAVGHDNSWVLAPTGRAIHNAVFPGASGPTEILFTTDNSRRVRARCIPSARSGDAAATLRSWRFVSSLLVYFPLSAGCSRLLQFGHVRAQFRQLGGEGVLGTQWHTEGHIKNNKGFRGRPRQDDGEGSSVPGETN